MKSVKKIKVCRAAHACSSSQSNVAGIWREGVAAVSVIASQRAASQVPSLSH